MRWFGDPLGGMSWKTTGYAWLAVYFARLTLWHWIEDRWGRA